LPYDAHHKYWLLAFDRADVFKQVFSNEDVKHMVASVRDAFQFKDTVVPAEQSTEDASLRGSGANAAADDDDGDESIADGINVAVTADDLVARFPNCPIHLFARGKGYFVIDEARLSTKPMAALGAPPDAVADPGPNDVVDVTNSDTSVDGDPEGSDTGAHDPVPGLAELPETISRDQLQHNPSEVTVLSGATRQNGGGLSFDVTSSINVAGRPVFLTSIAHDQPPPPVEGAQLHSRTRPLLVSGRGVSVDLLLHQVGSSSESNHANALDESSPEEPNRISQSVCLAAGERLRWEVPVTQDRPYEFSPLEKLSRNKIFFVQEDSGLSEGTEAGNRFKLKCNCSLYNRAGTRVLREARICVHIVRVVAFREAATGNVVDEEFFYPSVVDADFLEAKARSRAATRSSGDGRTAESVYQRVMKMLQDRIDAWAASKFNPSSPAFNPSGSLPHEDSNFCDKAIREAESGLAHLDTVMALLEHPGQRNVTRLQAPMRELQPRFATTTRLPWEVRRSVIDIERQRANQRRSNGHRLQQSSSNASRDGDPSPKRSRVMRNASGVTQRANANFVESSQTAGHGLRPVPRPPTETLLQERCSTNLP
jgi:hypothetical protein